MVYKKLLSLSSICNENDELKFHIWVFLVKIGYQLHRQGNSKNGFFFYSSCHWYAPDDFYFTDPFEAEVMNKNSIHRYFWLKLEMCIILKFTSSNLLFDRNRLFVHSLSIIILLQSQTKVFTMFSHN